MPYNYIIIADGETIRTLTIGKSKYTFESMYKTLCIEHLFVIAGCYFAYKSIFS